MKQKTILFILAFFSLALLLVSVFKNAPNNNIKRTKPDQCMSCHSSMSDMDHAHPKEIFGCAVCHGGNAWATDKESAHRGIVLNPARLEHAAIFCVKCHKDILKRVKKSMMNSQSGILNVLKYQWGESKELNSTTGIQDIRGDKNISLAQNHFRKLCAACHINQDEKVFKNQKIARGGGCSDCHRITKTKGEHHATYSTRIPNKNCLKCHNRSNRIGLSYEGIFESEGYGTPYKHGDFTHKMSDGRRFYYKLPDDIHHKKGMNCIDCHTEKGVMGDGKKHYHMEEAEDVKCKDCHKPNFKKANTLAKTLAETNEKVPYPKTVAYTQKFDSPLYNLQKEGNTTSFYTKLDGKRLALTEMSDKPYHTLAIHKRLDCSACHSSWAPSCYGCHEVYFQNGKQFDWVERRSTKGQWQELRSFLRFESPSLGIGYNKKIMPFAPGCQVIGTVFGVKSDPIHFHSMAMAGWDPHTTQKSSRTCEDCHFNPATLGLGRGNLDIKDGNITFTPIYNSTKSGMPFSYPIDAFVSVEGKQFQSTSRKEARSFNRKELNKIVKAYRCIICHNSYDDKIYVDFNKSKKLFYSGKTPCLK